MARPVRFSEGVPVYRYRTEPETPPVEVLRFPGDGLSEHASRIIHDFPALLYIERAGEPPGPSREGEVYAAAAGAAIDPSIVRPIGAACGLFFNPAFLDSEGQTAWPTWRAHPLLFPFLHGVPGGLLRLRVPAERRPLWSATIAAIERELADREEGYRQAVRAHLTLLLVDVVRMAEGVAGELRRADEPLLVAVFEVIEERLGESLSLSDIAQRIGMSPAYLTTVVRKRTGRTVMGWVHELRMAHARKLLGETDLPIGEIARRVGMPDPAYFARSFRRSSGATPRDWRHAAATGAGGRDT
ncbi:AraC family transcriptional regulator [Sinomonas sp. ASV322]|uniref:helix-turn-helix transcriptional regulator n=1 Tax=Sinomonas sp. ASV322 TaxID=3041920 RepID=UPI0027DBBF70|nr:AraC family transcriptional regulator [Sinomonas sp. ASV322]MDQ4501443.1 AraC family transcriptional regulator [Sinomonas sp. ASV322]